jgi:hypothetical protein
LPLARLLRMSRSRGNYGAKRREAG